MPHNQQQHQPKKAKRKGQQTDPTAYFTTPLTKKAAKQQAQLTARLATRSAARQLKSEQRAAQQQIGRDQGYYKQYEATIPTQASAAAQATQTALQQIGATSDAGAQYAEQMRQKLADEARADAASRGATYDPSLDQTDVAAQLARMNAAGILSGVTSAQGASTQGLFAARADNAKRQALQQRITDVGTKRSINADKRALAEKKGDLVKQGFTDAIGRERDYELSQQAAALNAKGQKIDARNTRRSQKLTAKQNRIEDQLRAESQAETHRHNQASESTSAQNAQTSARAERRQRRQDRYDRRHPNAGDSPNENPHAPDSNHVNHALATLNQTKPHWFDGKTIGEIVDALLANNATLTRKEATIAAKRWLRQHAHGF